MRGRNDRQGSSVRSDARYARSDRPVRGRSIGWLTSLLLIVSLLAPYATVQSSLAAPDSSSPESGASLQQRNNTPPPLEGVFSVTVGGDVAQLVGNIALSPAGDGMWVGSASLGPGAYAFQVIVATNTGAVTLGQDGLLSPPANQAAFTVPDGSQAAIFAFNESTGAVNAGGALFEIVTDVGQFQMLPAPQGTYEVYFNSPPDSPITIQPLLLGEPTGETAQATAGDSGRIHVVLNSAGQIQTAEAVQTATLDVVKADQNGNPMPGACFTAYGGGDSVAGQACDSADGSLDGWSRISFPNGLPDGNVDLVETSTPDGQPLSDPQSIDLGSGAQQLQMIAQVEGQEPPEEEQPVEETPTPEQPEVEQPPAEGGFTLTFFAVDLNGNSLPGACFAVDGGEPVCDDDGDGSVVITNVQPGTRTLSEPRSPDGFEPYPDIQLQITRDEQFSVPHNPGVSAQLPEDTSTISLQSVDQNGNLLPGACYQLDTGATACDDDFDGVVTFENLANGTYNVVQTQTPEGAQPLDPFQLEVNGSAELQVPHQTTSEPEEPEVTEGFTLGFVSVDENQNGLPFACFSFDGGDPVCDEDGDGVVTFNDVQPGLHTLTQTQAPEGYDNVGSVEVNVEQDANFAVRHTASSIPEEPEPTPTQEEEVTGLTVGFVSVDQDDNGLPGACFTLDGGDENCDDDGDAEVTFTGVQPGAHTLTQTRAPEGYDNVGTLELDLQNDGRFAVRHQPTAGEEPEQPEGTGQIVARTIDQDGNTLPEVCYELSGFGQQCDGDDEDNDMTQEDVPAGEYTVALVVPEGYEAVGETSQTVTVVDGETTVVEFQVQLSEEATPEETPVPPAEDGVGSIAAIAVEEGFPILDACIAFDGPATGEVCDNQTGDADPAQGSVLITDLPVGSYQVAMPNPPAGFDPAPAVTADVTDGGIAQVQLIVGGQPQEPEVEETPAADTGNLTILKVDPEGNPLSGSCFQVGDGAPVCDNTEGDTDGLEGVIRIENIPAGDQVVTETTAPEGYEIVQPGTVTIQAGDDLQVQVVNQPIQQALGSFRVLKRQPDETRIPGSCFAITATDGTVLGPWCDDDEFDNDDRVGVMEIHDIPVGDYTLTETTVPEGYVGAPDVTFTVTEGERASITVYNDFATGTVVIAKVDQNGAALGGACFLVGETEYCDDAEGDINGEPGIIQIEGVTVGSVTVSESAAPEGYSLVSEPQTVEVVANDTVSASFINQPLAGSLLINKTDESGEFLAGACFQVGEAEICDNSEGDENPDTGTILVSGLPAGEMTIAETVAPAGYAIADEAQTVEIIANDTVGLDFADRLLSGTVVIRKTDDAGSALGGACFSVGGQEVCDNGAGDLNAEEGIIEIAGIRAGDVEVTETAPPVGYSAAGDPQTVAVADGGSAEVSFVNVRELGNLRIEKTDESGSPLGGSCFGIGDTEICDNGEGDVNPDEGVIEVTGLGAGPTDVVETVAPDGYTGADSQTVDIPANDTVSIVVVNTRQTGSVQISTLSEGGTALGGACYRVGDVEVCDDQEGDQSGDVGIVNVGGVPTGDVLVTQTLAPEGFGLVAEPQTVTVASDETAELDFGSAALVGGLRIEKVDENGSPVGGACFAVGAQRVCDNDEFDENGDDGIIQLSGLPIGPIGVSETTVPPGYDADGISQSLQIVADQVVTTAFVNTRLTGTVRIDKSDQDGAPLGGACFAIGEQQVCDDGAGDTNSDPGVIEVAGVPIGTVTVSETSAPDGYAADGTAQTVEVSSGETTSITMVNTILRGGIRVEKVDEDGNLLAGACFTFGGQEICDNGEGDTNGDDGIVEVGSIPVGPVDVIETSAPEGYAATGGTTVQVVADDVITATFTNVRLVGGVRILKIDENGDPLAGACFTVAGTEVCDNGDGDLNPDEGVIEVGSVPTGPVDIVESAAPEGYVAADTVTVEVTADSVIDVEVSNARALGAIRITKTDEDENPLAGACFTIGDIGEICDNGEGDANGDDGIVEVGGIPVGSVEITESQSPEGYAGGESTTVQVSADGVANAEFVNVRLVGGIRILKTDENGDPLSGACFSVAGAEVCDNDEGDLSADDGVIEIGTVPTGSVDVIETAAPEGYLVAGPVTVDVTVDSVVEVEVSNTRALGSLRITKTDEEGNPLAGACFTIGDGGEICDNSESDANGDDGVVEVGEIPVGSVSVTESSAPEGYAAAESQTAQVVADGVATVEFVNVRQVGGIRVLKTDERGDPLAGACFSIDGTEVCDNGEGDLNADDGVIEIDGIPTGPVEVVETTAPDGYLIAGPVTVDVAADTTVDVTIENELATGSVVISKTDQDGNPLAGACFTVGDADEVCDNGDGDLNNEAGTIEIGSIPAGTASIAESTSPNGYAAGADQTVEVIAGEAATVSVSNERLTGSLTISKVDGSGVSLGGSCFTVGEREICDDGDGDSNDAPGVIQITGIPTGAVEVTESTVPDGYAGADPQTAEITVDGPATLSFVNTRLTGGVTINKNNDSGEPLGGACFTIGDIDVCDNDDTDLNDAEGVIEVDGVPTGTVDVTETSAPEGYAVAAPQSVDVRQDERATITVVNTLLTGSVQILKTDENGEPLSGSCFLVDGQEVCDGGETDENEADGAILVSEIEIGPIVVSETVAPDGYALAADAQTVEIQTDAIVDVTFVNALAVGIVSITKTDENGEPLAGACFTVGEMEVCDNQEGDANPADGLVDVAGIPVGTVDVTETVAPENYVAAAEPQSVEVGEGETVPVTFVNTLAIGTLIITKSDEAGEPLGGACFTVDGGEPVCDNGDSDENGDDGTIEIASVPVGSRSVAESQAPEGYVAAAEPQAVEIVMGESATIDFVNQLAIGTIRILKTADDTGDPLGGACFAVDDGEPVCDNGEGDGDSALGVIAITATVGEHTVTETQSPEGYDAVTPGTTVTVQLGESVDVPFVNTRFTGSLSLTKTDNQTGDYLSGACFTLDGETSYGPICDNDDGDADSADGVILLQGIEPGVYTITETTTPEGYVAPDGPVLENVVIAGGTVTNLEIENEPEGASVRPILPPVGGLEITSVDEEGNAVGGACFSLTGATGVGPVCDNDAADLDPELGVIQIGDIPTGEYTLAETTTPEGFTPSSPRTVVIGIDATVEVEIVHSATPVEPGSLRIRALDADGNPVGGACFAWGTGSQCDNLAGDGDPAVGVILVTGLVAGDYTVAGTEPPVSMVLADPQTVTIVAGEEATLEFTHEAAAEETGGLEFQLKDDNGALVPGACVALSEASNSAEDLVFCDGGEEDTNPEPGVLTIENLPVGTYSVSQAAVQGGDSAAVSGVSFKMQLDGLPTVVQAASEKTVQVKPNVIVVVIIIIIIEPPQTGGLDVVKRSQDTNILQPGACFQVTGQGNDIEICDNDGLDTNLTQGVVRFVNLPEGLYTVHETKSPPGYDPDADSEVAIVGGVVTTITFRNPPTVDPVGDLTVLKVNPDGDPISGTCFELREGSDLVAGPVCDADDGANDGSIVFTDIEPGSYVLRETQAASSDYQPIPDQPVTIVAGQNTELPVVNTLKPGSILITKLDDQGNGPLAGACFGLDRGNGIEFEVCDQQMGDGDLEEGIILVNNVPPGDYDLVETLAPAGFDPSPAIPVTVNPATQLQLEVENTPSVPPTDTGDLTVIKRNQKGEPLPGACFALRQGAVIKVAPRCDGDDGNLDGRISFADVGVGQYGIIETKKPSADYQTPPEKFVTITKDQAIDIVIVNVLKSGRIQITKVNQQNQPLANACFTVSPGYFAQKCTDGNGVVVFNNLPPGVYTVTETQAPYGYLAAPAVTNVVVKPGLTTPVKIVNQKAPPPADAGSLRVIKFFCPLLGNSQELWSVYDSSDANQKTLAQTANCKKGDATFVLKPTAPGDLVSIKFVTGADGIAHLTLKAGTYTLTELGTGVTTQVEVFVSQQTTVVVLNYVKPPAPGPAAINVYKFTCDPGFQGQFYLDFIGACGATENLTNNVTFRISGAAVATGVTGDGGQRGRTLFTQLPSGLYLLREETPTGSGQVYMWCGLQIDSYEYGAIGNQIAFPLQAGQTMWCAAFNVPDLVTDTTGSLVVQKYACELPPVKRPANFDWFAECGLQTTGAKFGLSELVDGQYVPKLTGLTNVNGLLTFDGLKPGTYKLQEIGGDWCHAESDSVNATGDVIIRAGQRSNVWIFNCIPTVGPPNTGAGTTAGHAPANAGIGTIEASSAPTGALLIWPVLALLGFAARRRWSASRAA